MLSVVLLLVSVCAFVVWCVRVRVTQSCAHALPPAYPGELPIVGHLHQLWTDTSNSMVESNDAAANHMVVKGCRLSGLVSQIVFDLWQLLKSISMDSLKQGGVNYVKFGKTTYMITDPDDAVTAANACLQKHFVYTFAHNWLGKGLVTSSGSKWQLRHKLMIPAFSMPVIHGFLEVFNDRAREFVKAINRHVGKPEYNTIPDVKILAFENSCLTTFGNRDLKSGSFFMKYLEALDQMFHILTNRFQTFWQHSDFIYSLWLKKKEDMFVNTINELSDEVIKKFKETLTSEATLDTSYKPILHTILQRTGNDALNDLDIRTELNTTIAASYESTSITLAIILALLGSFPEVQEKLYEEVINTIDTDADVDKYSLRKLVYTEAIIKESLRLFPPAPIVARYIDKDLKLKNYTLRAGCDIVFMFYGMHRHPSWGPDAEQFKPERWLDPASLPENPNAFAAFSIGKRSCIGRTYAMAAVKVTLAHFIRKYRWTADYTKIQFKIDTTLKPVSGHEITLQRRS